jgi:formiminotetrahydrofolate cyclodeaminase
MSQFASLSVSDFLDALSSPDPTPGGGTASAITGAIGVSLLMMVSSLAKTKTGSDDERLAMDDARATLGLLRATLVTLADADSAAFDAVMAAYRLPKASDQEKAVRTAAIQQALWAATEVPLETLHACADALAEAPAVARCGNPTAASDVGVAIRLLEAAAAGADANVRINLSGIRDESRKANADHDATALMQRAAASASSARDLLG